MKTKVSILALLTAMAVLFCFGQPARADLALTGPTDIVTGFPLFYQDPAGAQLSLCDVISAIPETPPCPSLTLTDPGAGVVAGNIVEAVYYAATVDFFGPNGERIVVAGLVEAAQGDPIVVPPEPDAVINDVIISLTLLSVPGNYTIVTPWGTFGPFVVAAGQTVLRPDSGVGALAEAPAFDGARLGPIQIFIGNGTGTPGFLGDGITPAPLAAPGPNGSVVRIEGAITAETNLFTVEGKALSFGLNVVKAGNGTGTVTDDLAQINCGLDCVGTYTPGTLVNLTPVAAVGSTFVAWTGCNTVAPVTNVCTVTMISNRTVTVEFSSASIAVTPTGDFGNINVDSVILRTFTLTNGSTAVNLNVGTILLAGSAAFTKPVDNCSGQTVLPGANCTLQIRLLPTLVGNTTGTLTIPSNDPINPNLVVNLTTFGTNAQVFTDVLGTSLFENHINSMFYNGVTLGIGGGLFGPNGLVTRGQMSAFIIRALEGDPVGTCPAAPFTDVPATNPFCMHITRMAQLGITLGIGGGLFGPDQNVTRGQMSAFIIRALEGDPPSTTALTAPMSGAQMVPPVVPAGTGTANVTVNLITGTMTGTLSFLNLTTPATLAHIHQAASGVSGPVVLDFTSAITPGQTTGSIPINLTLTPALIDALVAGNLYFAVHTVQNPGGEIRGQIAFPISQRFSDVPGNNQFFKHIDRMAALGITLGIGGGLFGPDQNVPREQMAAFIARAFLGIP